MDAIEKAIRIAELLDVRKKAEEEIEGLIAGSVKRKWTKRTPEDPQPQPQPQLA